MFPFGVGLILIMQWLLVTYLSICVTKRNSFISFIGNLSILRIAPSVPIYKVLLIELWFLKIWLKLVKYNKSVQNILSFLKCSQ